MKAQQRIQRIEAKRTKAEGKPKQKEAEAEPEPEEESPKKGEAQKRRPEKTPSRGCRGKEERIAEECGAEGEQRAERGKKKGRARGSHG